MCMSGVCDDSLMEACSLQWEGSVMEKRKCDRCISEKLPLEWFSVACACIGRMDRTDVDVL